MLRFFENLVNKKREKNMKKILIIQTSLSKASKTAIVAQKAYEIAKNKWLEVEILDLREYKLELCNWEKIENYNSDMNIIKDKVENSDLYILAYPIHNYSFSWVCKNFIDIFSYYMDSKKCSIIQNSYSVRSFSDWYSEVTKTLWLHNNIDIILPLVHSHNEDFESDKLVWKKSIEKIDKMIDNLIK